MPVQLAAVLTQGWTSAFSGGLSYGSSGYTCTGGVDCIAGTIITLINSTLVPLVFALAFIVFLWGVAKAYILSRGNQTTVKEGHQLIIWGIAGFVVMLSVWGLVNVFANTFGLTNDAAPPLPTTYDATPLNI